MEPFSIRWRDSTKKDIRKLPRQDVARVIEAVGLLADEPLPHGSQKLAGSDRLVGNGLPPSEEDDEFADADGVLPEQSVGRVGG